MNFFRSATAEAYEAVRASLDATYGYPNDATKTLTAIPPASEQPKDVAGRVYLIASDAECMYPAVAELMPQLLASGIVEMVTESEWLSEFPPPF